MSGEGSTRFDGMDELVRELDRKGRVLVEQVLEDKDGAPQRELWIARIGKPYHRLTTIDPNLFGPVVVSEEIVRGPLPNVWSHRDRLEENRRIVEEDEESARDFLSGTWRINRIVGISIVLLLLGIAAKCAFDRPAPEPEGYRIVQ